MQKNIDKEYKRKINNLNKEIQDLLVIIDTAQTVLRRASNVLEDCNKEQHQYVFSRAAKWVMEWKPNQTKIMN
tara:strand:- start:120 stop:338 length:219 start_codon:yes stop_codon:yes gene_type:complete